MKTSDSFLFNITTCANMGFPSRIKGPPPVFYLSPFFLTNFVNFDKNTQVKSKQIKSTCFNLYFCNFRVFGRHVLVCEGPTVRTQEEVP